MVFQKYNVEDNAYSTLLVGISASATSLQVQAGAGDLFPTSNFIATIVQYETPGDETSDVVKREKVLVSNNATDTFTITRGFDGDTGLAFDAGDFIYLNVVSKIIDDIQDEVERLETDKLDSNGELRTGLTAYRLLLIDSSGNETELALGTSGQILISQGTTSNPIWQAPTVDINGLTAETTPAGTDLAVIYDGTGNKKTTLTNLTKGLNESSETVKGTVERATDAEALDGTDTTRYITPKQVKDNYDVVTNGGRSFISIDVSDNSSRTSSTINVPKTSVAELSLTSESSLSGSFVRLEYDDGSGFTTLHNASNISYTMIFMCKKGSYRLVGEKNYSGTDDQFGTFQTTI